MACDAFFPTPNRQVRSKDIIWSFVISIFVIIFWCGTWRLAEEYFMKGEDYYTAWIVCPVSAMILVIITCLKPMFRTAFKDKEEEGLYAITIRLFNYVHACCYIVQWVGVWNLMNIYHGKGWENSFKWLLCSVLLATLCGVLSTGLRSPYFIRLDGRPRAKFFGVKTRFDAEVNIKHV